MLKKFSLKELRMQRGRMLFQGVKEISLWRFLFFVGTPLSLVLSSLLYFVNNNSNVFFLYVAVGVLIQLAFACRLIFRKGDDFIPIAVLYLLCNKFADFKQPLLPMYEENKSAYTINIFNAILLFPLYLLCSLSTFSPIFIVIPNLLAMLVAFVFKHVYGDYLTMRETEENNEEDEVNKYFVIRNRVHTSLDKSFNKREVLKVNNTIDLINQIVEKLTKKKENKVEIRNHDMYMNCVGFMEDLATLVEKYRSLGEFQDESVLDNVYEEALEFNKNASQKIEDLSKEDVKALVDRTRLMLNAPNAMEMYDNRLFGLEPKEYAVSEIGDMYLGIKDEKKEVGKEEEEED